MFTEIILLKIQTEQEERLAGVLNFQTIVGNPPIKQ